MKILLITREGEGLGLAHRMVTEGHDVDVFPINIDLKNHSGIYNVVDNLWKSVKQVKFVIADSPGFTGISKKLSHFNRPIIGTNETLEHGLKDASRQYELFKRLEIPTPETRVFSDVGDIFSGSLDWDYARTVIRFGEEEIRCDYKDWMAWSLNKLPVGQKVLFQRAQSGVGIIVSGWFDGLKWYDSFSVAPDLDGTFYGYSMVSPLSSDSRLVTETIVKLEKILKRLDYHGPVHMNLIVDKMNIVATDIAIGFIYPLAYTVLEFVKDELGEFLHNIAFSGNFTPQKTKDYVGVVQGKCVGKDLEGAPIIGLNDKRLEHIVFHHVSKEEDEDGEEYILAKSDSCVFTATAHGDTRKTVSERVYMTSENIRFPQKHFNTTLLNSVDRTFTKLQNWKYI